MAVPLSPLLIEKDFFVASLKIENPHVLYIIIHFTKIKIHYAINLVHKGWIW